MPSNVELNAGTGGSSLTTKQRTHDGDTTQCQSVAIAGVSGTEDAYTFVDVGAGGGTEATALRVTLANDSTGVVSVDDNGGSLTVDGTVTANLSATDNAVLDQIEVNTSYGDNAGGGVEAGALRVTIANDSTGLLSVDDNGGSLTVDNAALAVTGGGVEASALRVTLANDSTGVVSVDDNGGSLTVDNAALTELAAAIDTEVQVDVVGPLPAGTSSIGNVGIVPRTTGGMTIFRSLDLDETEEEVKATAGQVFSISAFNTTAAPLYLKFYNATAANVTVGTTTPVLTFVVPGNADSDGAGFVWNNVMGFAFGTAITVACTTGVADADTGAPGVNACIVNIGYA